MAALDEWTADLKTQSDGYCVIEKHAVAMGNQDAHPEQQVTGSVGQAVSNICLYITTDTYKALDNSDTRMNLVNGVSKIRKILITHLR